MTQMGRTLTLSTSLIRHLRAPRLPGLPQPRRLPLLRCHDGLLPRHGLRGRQHHPLRYDRRPGECRREHIDMVGLPSQIDTAGWAGFANERGGNSSSACTSLTVVQEYPSGGSTWMIYDCLEYMGVPSGASVIYQTLPSGIPSTTSKLGSGDSDTRSRC